MKFKILPLLFIMNFASNAMAEGACPPGQYPIGGQGAIACAPIPQENSIQQKARPSGKWLKTWGAIAMGTIDSTPHYGVPVGKSSKSEAESDALARCTKQGAIDCEVILAYFNQCAAIAEPSTPTGEIFGAVVATGRASIEQAVSAAQESCENKNKKNAKWFLRHAQNQLFKSTEFHFSLKFCLKLILSPTN
ncbi:DUF4189 domain-containing protein [Xanthomonas graminis]|nr:DUF4189 domain-containing protein [Xanthomonas translucens]